MSEVDEILVVIPSLTKKRAEKLLEQYGSAEEVINRFFDGQIPQIEQSDEKGDVANEEPIEIASNSTCSTITAPLDGNDDDDDRRNDFEGETQTFTVTASTETHVTSYSPPSDNYNYGDELPDLPDSFDGVIEMSEYSSEINYTKPTSPVHETAEPPKPKAKRGRKKKEDVPAEPVLLAPKKRTVNNSASIEVLLGVALMEKGDHLSECLVKSLQADSGIMEKQASLPCPCNISTWPDAPHPYCIRWVYHKPTAVLDGEESSDGIYAVPGSDFIAELQPELAVLLPMESFVQMCQPGGDIDLSAFCRNLISSVGENVGKIVLIVPDPDKYFKQRISDQRKQFRLQMQGTGGGGGVNLPQVSLDDMESVRLIFL